MEGPLTEHRARVVWEGTKQDLRAHRVETGGITLAGSCSPQWGGDPEKADPEDMLVGALSSCHMLWFVSLARERRLRLASYEDKAVGTLDHETFAFTRVELRPAVVFWDDPGPEVHDELHREAHRRCYIANSVSCPVTIEPIVVITGEGDRMSDEQGRLKISELATEAGVPVATVRHYLREGLLPEGEKTSRNMAYYPPELVERIRLIKQLQEERFMPLRVIKELLDREGGDPELLRSRIETSERVFELALAGEQERVTEAELVLRFGVPEEVIRALAEVGVIGPDEGGYSDSDARIVDAIARFRAGGYDERMGFTVHEVARFLEPLEELAEREVTMLSEKLVGPLEHDRVVELFEAASGRCVR